MESRRRVPRRLAPELLLALIVLLGTAFASRWALTVDEWRVMTDELSYIKLAQSIADTFSPLPRLRGDSVYAYNQLYPLLLAPLVGLFDTPVAFRLAHGLNALLMASTAIPTYLLVRLVLRSSPWPALAAAALSAVVPWLTLTLSLMTEAVSYPAFAWASYAVVLTLARPSPKHDVFAVVAVVVAYLARTQFAYLALALPLAVVLHEVGYRLTGAPPRRWPGLLVEGLRASVTRHLVLAVCVALGVGAAALSSAYTPLGNYQGVTASFGFSPGLFESLWDHLTQIAIGVGVLPVVLTLAWLGETLIRPASRPAHALAVHTLIVAPALALIVTYFDLNYAGGVHERYLFYIVPLLLAGGVIGIATIRWPLASISAAGLATIVLLVQSDYPRLGAFSLFSSPVRVTWTALDFRADQLGSLVGIDDLSTGPALALATALLCAAVAGAVWLGRRRAALVATSAALLVWMMAVTAYVFPKVLAEHEQMAKNALAELPMGERDWIDEAVGADSEVATIPSQINSRGGSTIPEGTVTDQAVWWQVEYWNKAVRRQYVYAGALSHTPFPNDSAVLDAREGRLRVSGGESDYLAVSRSNVRMAPDGPVVSDADPDLLLYRPSHPYRVAWVTEGVYDNGTMPGGQAALRVYGRQRSGGRVHRVQLLLDAGPSKQGPFRVRARGGVSLSGRIEKNAAPTFELCVPAGRTRKASIGTNSTGARLVQLDVRRLARSCDPS